MKLTVLLWLLVYLENIIQFKIKLISYKITKMPVFNCIILYIINEIEIFFDVQKNIMKNLKLFVTNILDFCNETH